jgi:hypothetical protein
VEGGCLVVTKKKPEDFEEVFLFNKYGHLLYHPELHPNYGEPFSEEDLEYLCKYWEVSSPREMSYALERPEHNLCSKVAYLKKTNRFDFYKNLNKYW